MSIETSKVIDAIGTEKNGSGITLTITDHLEWGNRNHLVLLQEKSNSYSCVHEKWRNFRRVPESENKKLKVSVVCKYEPDEEGKRFLSQCKTILEEAGFGFSYEVPRI